MIIGIGIDVIEIERIKKAVQNEHFKNKVYTKIEQNYCESRGNQSAASYAARFAAKEAFFKAMGTGINTELTDVEVINNELGQPEIFLHGKAFQAAKNLGVEKIFVSLSHSREYATATAVIEK
ncbi:MAG: holo-ACP synthase [Selenomonadaceae bacterium]|nr:holo-ACP synthase [Selenomonadaceae bacterium]